jgi:hypothetical protein
MKLDKIPLAYKPFITALEKHCNKITKDDLIETILSFAGEIVPRERASFLDKISYHSGRAIRVLDSDHLISRIEGICEDIQARSSAIEDGSYRMIHHSVCANEGLVLRDPCFCCPPKTSGSMK